MVIVVGTDGRRKPLLFPITSQPPGPSNHSVEVPEAEARRAKLYTPAWVIVDEFNTDDLAASWALEDAKPLERFSRKFMARIAAAPRPGLSDPVRHAASRGDNRGCRTGRTHADTIGTSPIRVV